MARILIIDDDREVCETLESLGHRLGQECLTARNLKDGLAHLGRDAFELVFLDVRLPDGTGWRPWARSAARRRRPTSSC